MPVRVAVPDLISNSYFPAVAAVELGLFEEQGIDARLDLFFPVTTLVGELRDGKWDFVAGAAHAPLYAFKDWEGAALLCALARHMYWFLVVRADLGARRGDLSVVKGLRIGAAPGPVDGLRRLLAEAGLDETGDRIQIGPVPGTAGAGASFGVSAAKALARGDIDAFWANGMGAEVAVRSGVGTIVLDVRRDGPAAAQGYTFPALYTTRALIARDPDLAAGAVRAIVGAQQRLREDPERATAIGRKLFPPEEASLIAELIRRDVPFYDAAISEDDVRTLNAFGQAMGLLARDVPYEQVVATPFRELWRG